MSEPAEFQGKSRTDLVWEIQRARDLQRGAEEQCKRAQQGREQAERERDEADAEAAECDHARLDAEARAERLAEELGKIEHIAGPRGREHAPRLVIQEIASAAVADTNPPPRSKALDDLIAAVMRGVDQVTRDLLERAHVSLTDEKEGE